MGLKAAVAETEVMRLGKGTEWPGWGQGHYKHQSDPWGQPPRHRSRILGCRPSPLLLPQELRSLSEREAAGRTQHQGPAGMPTPLWEASP